MLFHSSRRNLTCEYNASFVTREWLAPVTRGGTLQRQTSFLTTLRNFLTGRRAPFPIFHALCRRYNETASFQPVRERCFETGIVVRLTYYAVLGGCDCHEGSKRSKCFRITLEGPPSFVRLLFVLFVDEERVSPFYTRIL